MSLLPHPPNLHTQYLLSLKSPNCGKPAWSPGPSVPACGQLARMASRYPTWVFPIPAMLPNNKGLTHFFSETQISNSAMVIILIICMCSPIERNSQSGRAFKVPCVSNTLFHFFIAPLGNGHCHSHFTGRRMAAPQHSNRSKTGLSTT